MKIGMTKPNLESNLKAQNPNEQTKVQRQSLCAYQRLAIRPSFGFHSAAFEFRHSDFHTQLHRFVFDRFVVHLQQLALVEDHFLRVRPTMS